MRKTRWNPPPPQNTGSRRRRTFLLCLSVFLTVLSAYGVYRISFAAAAAAAAAAVAMSGEVVASRSPSFRAQETSLQRGIVQVLLEQQQEPVRPLSFSDVFGLLQESSAFRSFFSTLLLGFQCEAMFWECSPITQSTVRTTPFEFVMVPAPMLARARPDSGPFAEHLTSAARNSVISFSNLSGDAMLVCPAEGEGQTNNEPISSYGHLTDFLKSAPSEQVHSFWAEVGLRSEERVRERDERPTWINTHGGGVAWLHVRLDSSPKYYSHMPYTSFLPGKT